VFGLEGGDLKKDLESGQRKWVREKREKKKKTYFHTKLSIVINEIH
jgi:hypothetical protein